MNTITNIADFSNTTTTTEELSSTQEFQKINKIKYNLSLAYFAGLAVLMTTLFI